MFFIIAVVGYSNTQKKEKENWRQQPQIKQNISEFTNFFLNMLIFQRLFSLLVRLNNHDLVFTE